MPKTIILIRHAEALHNVDLAYHSVPDPPLTEHGHKQASELREALRAGILRNRKVSRIIVSPMRRVLQTAHIALDWLIEGEKVPVVADARWQELYPKPCDTPVPLSQLAPDFPKVDFTQCANDPVYPDKASSAAAKYHYTRTAVLARAQEALGEIYQLMESNSSQDEVVIVVSHSSFLRVGVTGRWFWNADYRVFDLVKGDPGRGEREYELVEWELTKGKGGMGWSKEVRVEIGGGLPDA